MLAKFSRRSLNRPMPKPDAGAFSFSKATTRDAVPLAALHTSVAAHLTEQHGFGPWSSGVSEKGMLFAMRHSTVYVMREEGRIIATLRLTTRKPWAIDTSYFSACRKPLYLLAMAVLPAWQRQGIGRSCLEHARRAAKTWLADAIRLDAYDAEAGAGGFYARNGFNEVGRNTYREARLIYFEALIG